MTTEKKPTRSWTRWIPVGIFLTGLIWLAYWLPAFAFHISFQKLITTGDLGEKSGGLLNVPVETFESPENQGDRRWHQVLFGDVLVSLPPGELTSVSSENNALTVHYTNRKVTVDRFPDRLVHQIFVEEFDQVGGGDAHRIPPEYLGMTPGELLVRVSNVTPAEYSFSMAAPERALYAALVCSKLRLWEFDDVDRAFSIAGENGEGVVMFSGANAKAIVSSAAGVFVFTIQGDLDRNEDHALWLEAMPALPELRAAWRAETEKRYPEDHPIRVWASR